MRCPKCNYISFDSPERCRHCGYEFALASPESPAVDLPLRNEDREPLGPPSDLPLEEGAASSPSAHDRERAGAPASPLELPLFSSGRADALRAAPARPPRPPLSVRRSSSDLGRPRDQSAPTPDASPRLDFIERDAIAPAFDQRAEPVQRSGEASTGAATPLSPAPLGRRIAAGVVDMALLGAIDSLVLYFTLQLTGLDLARAGRLPWAPFLGFLALLNGGYVTAFTIASGQTIGQMLTGVRVVAPEGGHIAAGAALVRAFGVALSWALAGLGFLPMFLSPDRRALHDRLAGTRVVRS